MDFTQIVDVFTSLSIAAGLVFAGIQWRESRREARRDSQIQLLRSFESPEYVRALRIVLDLPDGLTRSEIETRVGLEGTDLVWYWLGVMESLGVLTFHRFVNITDVDEVHGGPIVVSFSRLGRYVTDVRDKTGRDSMHEWFQWLAEHVEQLEESEGRIPAHIRERDWRP